MASYRERITVFNAFLSKCQQANNQNRDAMMNSVKFHTKQNKEYNDLYALLSDYEHKAVEYFSENTMEMRVLTHPKAGDIKDTVAETTRKYKNPF